MKTTKLLIGIVTAAGLAFGYAQQNGGSDYYFWERGNGYSGVLTEYNLCGPIYPHGCYPIAEHILTNITQMATNGQQILFLPIFFADNGLGPNANCPSGPGQVGAGVVVNSTNGTWPSACLSALEAIISWANTKGMRVGIAFYPAYNNFPGNWSTYDSFHANQNWQFIYNTHVALSNGQYSLDKYDLGNEELMPGSVYQQYLQFIWGQYASTFGSADTFGFSVDCDGACNSRLGLLQTIYGQYGYPPVLDLHIYGNSSPCSGTGNPTAYQEYTGAWQLLHTEGFNQPWVIGETCYNDQTTAQDVLAAQQYTGNTLQYLVQWPTTNTPTVDYCEYVILTGGTVPPGCVNDQ